MSLIEVVTAIAILALLSPWIFGTFWQGFREAEKFQLHSAAYNLAKEKLEEHSRVPLPANGDFPENYGAIPGFPAFRRFSRISDYGVGGRLRLVFVEVFWDNDRRRQSFSTLKMDY